MPFQSYSLSPQSKIARVGMARTSAQQEGKRMSNLSVVDGIGFGAAGLVLATFCMGSMNALRWVAIASNVAFIAYGYLGHLAPVLLLHALLLPVNIYRLAQLHTEPKGRCR